MTAIDSDRTARARKAWPGFIRACIPPALILLWTCAVRLPFYRSAGDDEFFFAVIAQKWLAGGLPYVATYDVKPPGLFAIYALAQNLFGESLATIKGLEILFTAAGGYALYRLARAFGSSAIALWAAALYPVYSLALSGMEAANLLLQMPFLILGYGALLAATRRDAPEGARLPAAFLSGLSLGMAGMLRQAVVFEVAAAFGLLLWSPPAVTVWRRAGLFLLGLAMPLAGFAAYFAVHRHLRAAIEAVVLAALTRSQGEVLAAHGSQPALHLTTWDVFGRLLAMMLPLLVLAIASLLTGTRRAVLRRHVSPGFLATATLWLAAAMADVLSARAMFAYYLLAALAPLLLLAATFAAHGWDAGPADTRRYQIALAAALLAWPLAMDRDALFSTGLKGPDDMLATDRAIAALAALHPEPRDHVLVLNRGLEIYVGLHLTPPAAYFHPKHLLCAFPTPSANPLAEALAAHPRFLVVADPAIYRLCEQPARFRLVADAVKTRYRLAAHVRGAWDSFSIYEWTGPR